MTRYAFGGVAFDAHGAMHRSPAAASGLGEDDTVVAVYSEILAERVGRPCGHVDDATAAAAWWEAVARVERALEERRAGPLGSLLLPGVVRKSVLVASVLGWERGGAAHA